MPKKKTTKSSSDMPKIPVPGKRRRKKSGIPVVLFALIVLIAVATVLVLELSGIYDFGLFDGPETTGSSSSSTVTGGTMEFHMIDIGQGDSILICAGGEYMLVDAGDNKSEHEKALKNYLDGQGVKELKYFVVTHHDSDHIGGADMVLKTYSVDTMLSEPYTYGSQTKVYSDMMSSVSSTTTVIDPSPEEVYTLGGDLKITILGPLNDYKDKNNNSIVMRLDYGSTSFMMTGDAEKKPEADMVAKYGRTKLDCDVLKVGHHGSDTSTSLDFLNAVSPDLAVISCGTGNSYGHPKAVTLEKFENSGITYYRTDLVGSIVLVSDGTKITVKDK